MSTVTYTPSQSGYWSIPTNWVAGPVIGGALNLGGLQFTVPAPNEILFRSLTLTLTTAGAGGVGNLSVYLSRDLDADPYSDTNTPLATNSILLFDSFENPAAGNPITVAFDLDPADPQTGSFVGNSFDTPGHILHHSDFQGVIALSIFFDGLGLPEMTGSLSTDQEPFLTGLTSGRDHQSRADFCPRCGTPLFREALVRDGYTKGLVCASCYDPPERKPGYWKPPKEVNP